VLSGIQLEDVVATLSSMGLLRFCKGAQLLNTQALTPKLIHDHFLLKDKKEMPNTVKFKPHLLLISL
jgi:hypothetical protein